MVTIRCLYLHGLLAMAMTSIAMRVRPKKEPKVTLSDASTLETDPEAASTVAEHPASLTCFLGSGFGIQKGCQYVPALQNIPSCDTAASGEACYRDTPTESVRGYSRDVRTSFDYSSLTESVTEAEGGGYGISVSASFSYMKRSQVSEKSTAFFIGSSGRTSVRTLDNPGALKLTSTAKQLLRTNASLFLQFYSSTFVHTLTYGGSFLGSVTVNSKETSDDRDIQAFAGFSVNKGVFSAGGNSSFQNTINEKTGRIEVFISADWKGGQVQQDYSAPEKMGDMFRSWDATWRTSPAPLTLVTRRWIDLVEVQEVVFGLPPDQMMMFFTESISPIIQKRISVENSAIMKVESSTRQALSWLAAKNDATMRSCLENLRDDIQRKRIGIDGMDDSQVLAIQAQFLNSDLSWFESATFESRYTSCVGSADKVCDGYTHNCNTWQVLNRDERVDWCLRNPSCTGSSSSPSNELLSSIASITASRGQDHLGLRDEVKKEFPGWEWIAVKVGASGSRRRRHAWAYNGWNIGDDRASDHYIVTGIHCPGTGPGCGKCQVKEDCVAEAIKGGPSEASVVNAHNNCGGGYSGTRTIIAVRADSWGRAWSLKTSGSCVLKGERHGNMYVITVAPGATMVSTTVGKPAASDSNQTAVDVLVNSEPNDFEVIPVAMDGSEVHATDVGDSSSD